MFSLQRPLSLPGSPFFILHSTPTECLGAWSGGMPVLGSRRTWALLSWMARTSAFLNNPPTTGPVQKGCCLCALHPRPLRCTMLSVLERQSPPPHPGGIKKGIGLNLRGDVDGGCVRHGQEWMGGGWEGGGSPGGPSGWSRRICHPHDHLFWCEQETGACQVDIEEFVCATIVKKMEKRENLAESIGQKKRIGVRMCDK